MNTITQCRPALGTFVEISLSAAEESEDALRDRGTTAFSEIDRIERLMSFHDPESELSRINRTAHLEPCNLSPEMEQLLRFALKLSRETAGKYDLSIAPELVRRGALPNSDHQPDSSANWKDIILEGNAVRFQKPMQLDLGGIAKGFAVDSAINVLGNEIEATVNAGGDLRMNCWEGETIGIKVPSRWRANSIIELPMRAPAVATSAAYYLEGKAVILSPQTRKPTKDRRSISVFAPDCMTADALTKVAFLAQNPSALFQELGAEAVAVDHRGKIHSL